MAVPAGPRWYHAEVLFPPFMFIYVVILFAALLFVFTLVEINLISYVFVTIGPPPSPRFWPCW